MLNPTEDILCVLAAMVLADNKIYACEVEAFVSSSQRLGSRYPELNIPDESSLFRWFEINRVALRERLTPQHFEGWLQEVCTRLRARQTFIPVARELFEIAQSDGKVHVAETALIQLLERNWKASRPSL